MPPLLAILLLLQPRVDTLLDAPPSTPRLTLDRLYYPDCARPGELVGYSFLDPIPELTEAVANGSNSGVWNWMWIPHLDPASPTGMAGPPLVDLRGVARVGQTVLLGRPAVGLGFATPTFVTTGAAATVRIYRLGDDGRETLVGYAEQADLEDCGTRFVPGDYPAGRYRLEIEKREGGSGRLGVWAHSAPGEGATANGDPLPALAVEVRALHADGAATDLIDVTGERSALEISGDRFDDWRRLGLGVAIYVGNWNNGGFPYYPDWFYARFPDAAMLDQDGEPLLTGMFDRQVPWLGFSHPEIVRGTSEHIRTTVEGLRDSDLLRYWVLGGESLYYTYLAPGRLTDYSKDSLDHFRAWLRERYQGDLTRLNQAWGSGFRTWEEVDAPRKLGQDAASWDFAHYRFVEVGDHFAWHYEAARAHDPTRIALSCNHGDLFRGLSYFGLGCDPTVYGQATDGFELGQIMSNDDAQRYNLLWMTSVQASRKPLAAPRLAYAKTNPRARGGASSFTPEAAQRYFGEAIGAGSWHAGFVQWYGDLPDGEWGVRGTPAEAEFASIFRQWHAIARRFDGSWPLWPRVGVLRSRRTWALGGFQPVWQALHEELIRRQLPYVALAGDTSWEGLEVVICADNGRLEADDRARLEGFLAAGGTVIVSETNGPAEGDLPGGLRLAEEGGAPDRARAIVDALGPAGRSPLGLSLEAHGPITRLYTKNLTGIEHDLPLDLSRGAIVQNLRAAEDGLVSVGVWCPTFSKTYAGAPLTVEVRDSAGRLVGEAAFPTDEMKDNAWHEIPLTEAQAEGTDLQVRLIPPAGLEPLQLGAWACTRAEPRPGEALLQAGVAVAGALDARLTYARPGEADEVLESFTLSDGANVVAVLVNTGNAPVAFRMAPDEALVPDLGWGREVGRLDTHTELGDDVVPAHTTAFVECRAVAPPEAAERAVAEARRRIEAAGHREDPFARAGLTRAEEALAAGLPHKAMAHALSLARSLTLPAEAWVEGGALRVRARVEPLLGGTAGDDLRAEATFVPLGGARLTLRPAAGGLVEGEIALTDLPKRYDYDARQYVPYWGALRVEVRARAGRLEGAAATVAHIAR